MDKLGDAVGCGLHNIGSLDIKLFAIGKESICIELGDLHDSLMLTLSALKHLVLTCIAVT